MSQFAMKHVTQREYRRFKCPCPECGNLYYVCPFDLDHSNNGGPIPPIPLACDEAPQAKAEPEEGSLKDEYDSVVRAYRAEYKGCVGSGREYGATFVKVARKLGSTYKSWYASPAACTAAQIAVTAHGLAFFDPVAALAGAHTALAHSHQCPDAYALRARLEARTYAEALELFESGYKDYKTLLSEAGWERCRTAFGADLAAAPPLQGAARCMVGAISTLCRMRRGGEAYERMQAMLEHTPIRETAGAHIWALAPEVVFRARGPAACLAWLCEHVCDEVLRSHGAAVWWVGTWALAWAATQQHEGFKWTSLFHSDDETRLLPPPPGSSPSSSSSAAAAAAAAGGGAFPQHYSAVSRPASAKLRSGLALGAAAMWLPHMLDMLLGDMPLPDGPQPPLALSPGSVGCQVAYVRYCGDLWRETPGVLDFARRYRNTYEVFCIACDARCSRPVRLDDFRRYMAAPPQPPPPPGPAPAPASSSSSSPSSQPQPQPPTAAAAAAPRAAACGIFPDAIMYEGCDTWHGLVDMACMFTHAGSDAPDPSFGGEQIEILTSLLAAGCPISPTPLHAGLRPRPSHTPLSFAMYRGYGPEAVRLLLRAGADPLEPDDAGTRPLLAAAEQGMWRELQAVFKMRRKLGSRQLPLGLAFLLLGQVLGGTGLPATAPATSVFELALVAAVTSPCVPCVAGLQRGCMRCMDETGGVDSPHGPWCSFHKVVEVLVAYGMKAAPQLLSWLWLHTQALPGLAARQALLVHLEGLLRGRAAEEAVATAAAAATADAGAGEEAERDRAKAEKEKAEKEKVEKVEGEKVEKQKDREGKVGEEQLAAQAGQRRGRGKEAPADGAEPGEAQETAAGAEPQQPEAGAQPATPGPGPGQEGERKRLGADGKNGGAAAFGEEGVRPLDADGDVAVALEVQASGCGAAAAAKGDGPPDLEPYQDNCHCWGCGKAKDRAAGVKLSKCSRCLTARYCCADCQHAHWRAHRAQCRALAAAAGQAGRD